MAKFSEDYFKGEEKEGFYVEEMMKRAWAAQIEVFEIIDRICTKHQIQYFADWGTLLGAVRHKGFIPWDDDIDIVMKRKDFNRFRSIFEEEQTEGCSLLSIYSEMDTFDQILMRVVNSHKVNYDEEHLRRWHGCPYAVGVDIFPLDKLPVNKEDEEIHYDLLRILWRTAYAEEQTEKQTEEQIEEQIEEIERVCGVSIDRTGDVKGQLLRLLDAVLQMFEEDGEDYAEVFYYLKDSNRRMKAEYYEESIRLPFETIDIPVPKEYDIVLRKLYGDYEVPKQWVAHDYPFYKKQQESVDEKKGYYQKLDEKMKQFMERMKL